MRFARPHDWNLPLSGNYSTHSTGWHILWLCLSCCQGQSTWSVQFRLQMAQGLLILLPCFSTLDMKKLIFWSLWMSSHPVWTHCLTWSRSRQWWGTAPSLLHRCCCQGTGGADAGIDFPRNLGQHPDRNNATNRSPFDALWEMGMRRQEHFFVSPLPFWPLSSNECASYLELSSQHSLSTVWYWQAPLCNESNNPCFPSTLGKPKVSLRHCQSARTSVMIALSPMLFPWSLDLHKSDFNQGCPSCRLWGITSSMQHLSDHATTSSKASMEALLIKWCFIMAAIGRRILPSSPVWPGKDIATVSTDLVRSQLHGVPSSQRPRPRSSVTPSLALVSFRCFKASALYPCSSKILFLLPLITMHLISSWGRSIGTVTICFLSLWMPNRDLHPVQLWPPGALEDLSHKVSVAFACSLSSFACFGQRLKISIPSCSTISKHILSPLPWHLVAQEQVLQVCPESFPWR